MQKPSHQILNVIKTRRFRLTYAGSLMIAGISLFSITTHNFMSQKNTQSIFIEESKKVLEKKYGMSTNELEKTTCIFGYLHYPAGGVFKVYHPFMPRKACEKATFENELETVSEAEYPIDGIVSILIALLGMRMFIQTYRNKKSK